MSNEELEDTAEYPMLEKVLEQHKAENEEVRQRLVKSDNDLAATRRQLEATLRQNKIKAEKLLISNAMLETKDLELAERQADLASSALVLSQRTAELYETNRYLARKTAELQDANEELMRVMQQREDFVAALTHDLKNPVLGTICIMENLLASPDVQSDALRTSMQTVIDANKSILRMIVNMLDVYKHEDGSIVPSFEPVDLKELLLHCLEEFSFAALEKRLVLTPDISSAGLITTDSMLLKRVITNLLDNAIKFTPAGGKVELKATEEESQVVISVSDSGAGLTDLQKRTVFLKYWQTKEGRQREIGTGLGLYLSKQLTELVGGTIDCQSEPGHGATFTIKLPRRGSEIVN